MGRPPGPSDRVRTAVIEAAAAELIDRGLVGLTVERVAARAGVARSTVYTHWPTRSALVVAVLDEWHVHRLAVPDTGSWRADLRGLCTSIAAGFSQPASKALLRTIVAAAANDPDLHAELLGVFAAGSGHLHEPVERAKLRGEVRGDVDTNHILGSISGPLFMQAVFADGRIDDRLIDWLVDSILVATAPLQ